MEARFAEINGSTESDRIIVSAVCDLCVGICFLLCNGFEWSDNVQLAVLRFEFGF